VKPRRRKWAWIGVAVGLLGALAAMYAYEKSLEEDLELMLRSALQQFSAEQSDSGTREP